MRDPVCVTIPHDAGERDASRKSTSKFSKTANMHLAGRGLLQQRVPALLVRREQRLHGRLRGPRRVGRLRVTAAAAAAAAAKRLGGVQLQDLPRAQSFRLKNGGAPWATVLVGRRPAPAPSRACTPPRSTAAFHHVRRLRAVGDVARAPPRCNLSCQVSAHTSCLHRCHTARALHMISSFSGHLMKRQRRPCRLCIS